MMPVIASGLPERGLHLFHHGLSSCSQRVRMLLAEGEMPFESHLVDLRVHAHLAADYLAINPRGLVPALIDDGNVVIESVDILRYLAERAGLGGSDDALLDAADRAQAPLKTLTHEYMFRARGAPDPATLPPHPDPGNADFAREYFEDGRAWNARLTADAAALAVFLEDVRARLAGGNWLGGDTLALADIAWMSTVHRLTLLGWPLPATIGTWYARIAARPAFTAAVTAWEPPGMAAAQAAYIETRRASGTGPEQNHGYP